MAGFIQKVGNTYRQGGVGQVLKDLSSLGMKYDDLVLKNSQSIGTIENEITGGMPAFFGGDDDYSLFLGMSLNDINFKKNIPFFEKDYPIKRDELRNVSMQDEIEEILDYMCDEAIVYDTKNYFAYADTIDSAAYKKSKLDQLNKKLNQNFKKIYSYFGFKDPNTAWGYFRKWLIDGYLAFEIIYDDPNKPKNIIGFKEMDAVSLSPGLDPNNKRIWFQYKGDIHKERILYDSQVIFISFSNINYPSRVSYVERLVRPFNILRIMEQTRIIWAVVNASFKTLFSIPMGSKSRNKARQSLRQVMNNYRETISFDNDSGGLTVDGRATQPFNKEYWLPEREGETPSIETIGNNGPDLSDTEALAYFANKLKLVSKIPFNRFDKTGTSIFEDSAEGTARDEIKFGRFLNRLRSIFQEILVKPLHIQMTLDFKELKTDEIFAENISIEFNMMNYFEQRKEQEAEIKAADYVQSMLGITDAEGNAYFPLEFLVKKAFDFTDDELEEIKKIKKEQEKEASLGDESDADLDLGDDTGSDDTSGKDDSDLGLADDDLDI